MALHIKIDSGWKHMPIKLKVEKKPVWLFKAQDHEGYPRLRAFDK